MLTRYGDDKCEYVSCRLCPDTLGDNYTPAACRKKRMNQGNGRSGLAGDNGTNVSGDSRSCLKGSLAMMKGCLLGGVSIDRNCCKVKWSTQCVWEWSWFLRPRGAVRVPGERRVKRWASVLTGVVCSS